MVALQFDETTSTQARFHLVVLCLRVQVVVRPADSQC